MRTLYFNVTAIAVLRVAAVLALLVSVLPMRPLVLSARAAQSAPKMVPTATVGARATTLPAQNRRTSSNSPEDWGAVQVVIYKSTRMLAIYRQGNFEKQYPVVLGLNPQGRKRHAHDARTPEGLYRIVAKRAHPRWQYFLSLDYPNAEDARLYADEVRSGRIPDENGHPFGIGSQLGIHGNDREDQQAAGVNWTKGCVALGSADVGEVAAIAEVGTPVWIVE